MAINPQFGQEAQTFPYVANNSMDVVNNQQKIDSNIAMNNSTPKKIEGTTQIDKSRPPLKTLCFPESLDTIPNSNCIVFEIIGDADIGINLSQSQRFNGNADILVDKLGGTVSSAFGKLTTAGNNTINSFSNTVTTFSNDGLSSLGSIAKGAVNWATSVGNSANAIAKDVQDIGDSISKSDIGIKKKPEKLNLMIKLPMPAEGIGAQYSMNYESEALGLSGALADAVVSGQGLSAFVQQSKGATLRGLAGYAAGAMDDLTKGNQSLLNVNGLLEAGTRTVLNPRKELLFKSVNYRTFNYSFTFAPNNASECFTVREIIRMFKEHMAPTLEENGFYLRYPSEFLISYHYNEGTNPFVNNIGKCALKDLTISYGKGNWSTLMNGSPTIILIHTTFLELEPLTRNRIRSEGF